MRIIETVIKTFAEMTESEKEKAIEKYREKYYFPQGDDVKELTEILAEFVANPLGLCDDADDPAISITWSSEGYERGVGLNGRIDLTRLKQRMAAKELSEEATYGKRYTGAQIIAAQESAASALEAFEALVNKEGIDYVDFSAWLEASRYNNTTMCHETDWNIDDSPAEEYLEAELEASSQKVILAFEMYADICTSVLLGMIDAEIEYRNSNEAIAETIVANEYEFDEEGNMV